MSKPTEQVAVAASFWVSGNRFTIILLYLDYDNLYYVDYSSCIYLYFVLLLLWLILDILEYISDIVDYGLLFIICWPFTFFIYTFYSYSYYVIYCVM